MVKRCQNHQAVPMYKLVRSNGGKDVSGNLRISHDIDATAKKFSF